MNYVKDNANGVILFAFPQQSTHHRLFLNFPVFLYVYLVMRTAGNATTKKRLSLNSRRTDFPDRQQFLFFNY